MTHLRQRLPVNQKQSEDEDELAKFDMIFS
jgi:hypothetical protein